LLIDLSQREAPTKGNRPGIGAFRKRQIIACGSRLDPGIETRRFVRYPVLPSWRRPIRISCIGINSTSRTGSG
jgi:hypothetical protein